MGADAPGVGAESFSQARTGDGGAAFFDARTGGRGGARCVETVPTGGRVRGRSYSRGRGPRDVAAPGDLGRHDASARARATSGAGLARGGAGRSRAIDAKGGGRSCFERRESPGARGLSGADRRAARGGRRGVKRWAFEGMAVAACGDEGIRRGPSSAGGGAIRTARSARRGRPPKRRAARQRVGPRFCRAGRRRPRGRPSFGRGGASPPSVVSASSSPAPNGLRTSFSGGVAPRRASRGRRWRRGGEPYTPRE
jgi:hypothetical protein